MWFCVFLGCHQQLSCLGSMPPAGMHHRGSKLVLMQIVAVSQYSLMKQMVSSRLYASADHSGPPL